MAEEDLGIPITAPGVTAPDIPHGPVIPVKPITPQPLVGEPPPDTGEGTGTGTAGGGGTGTETGGAQEPSLPGSVGDLSEIAMLIVILGLTALAFALLDALWKLILWALGPLRSRAAKDPPSQATWTQWLSNTLGQAEQGIDAALGQNFHKLAAIIDHLGEGMKSGASTQLKTAKRAASLTHHQAVQDNSADTQKNRQRAQHKQQEQEITNLRAQVRRNQQAEAMTSVQVGVLQHHLTTLIEPELDALRGSVKELQKGATTTWDEILKHEEMLGLGAMTGTVALAMGRLGASWTQCENTQTVGKAICGSDGNALRKLMRDGIPFLGIAELCASVKLIAAFAGNKQLLAGLGVFSIGIEKLLECTGATIAPPLPIGLPALAPVQQWATLAPVDGGSN